MEHGLARSNVLFLSVKILSDPCAIPPSNVTHTCQIKR